MAAKKKVEKEKPLEKMTATDLREIAKQIEGVVGVHGMNKTELVSIIKEARGITEAPKSGATTKQIKAKLKVAKVKRIEALEANDKKAATRYRRQVSRLKKKTRHVD
jgi:hypothetical protein